MSTPAPSLPRRTFLGLGGGAALATGAALTAGVPAWAAPRSGGSPFTLGVASGDPLPDGVVLWTRLAPDPLAPDGLGGMSGRAVPVRWQVAEDEGFARVVRSGTAVTNAAVGYSVHVDVRGLRPRRDYWYRFAVDAELSPVGRTRTAPAAGSPVNSLAFAFASCASLNHGQFTPYAHLAEEDLDAVVFLGDYLYANGSRNLADFRVDHALYKSDPNLQAAHQAAPWMIIIDDNDITNNWWDPMQDPARLELLTQGLQAFWENMPVRRSSRLVGGRLSLHRRLSFGDLATFHLLDTRQYRDQQIAQCSDAERVEQGYCPGQLDPARTMLGSEQEQWLLDGLSDSRTSWNVLANQGFFTQHDSDLEPGPENRSFSTDGWDGYVNSRQTILDHLRAEELRNTVVITGDSHRNWVLNTPPSFRDWDAEAEPVTTEFMVTSITSGRDRRLQQAFDPEPDTPHLLYRDASHGYARVQLTPELWQTDYRAVSTVEAPVADVQTLISWAVENGRPGALRV